MKTRSLLAITACLGFLSLSALAADWPQWRGPDRTDISTETGLRKSWPQQGPPLLWTFTDAGVGYSGLTIVGGKLFTMGSRNEKEFVICLDAKTGKETWAAPIGPVFTFNGNSWGDGPRATPTVNDGLVYALGGQGELVCVEAATGKEVWRKNMFKDLQGQGSEFGGTFWGYSWSPLVDGDQVICVPGGPQGTLAALEKKNGKVLWQSKELTSPAVYSSPLVAEINGVRQYIQMTEKGAAGVAAKDGQLLWSYDHKPAYNDVLIPTPLFHDNQVYLTAGMGDGIGSDLIKLSPSGTKFKAARVYFNKIMKNRLGGVVLVDGCVYGYSEQRGWVCQDFKTGKSNWEKKSLGAGSVTCADGHLYCYGEDDGVVALVEVNPKEWKETGRFAIPRKSTLLAVNGKIWTHPVVADGRLYLRDQELIFCYDVNDHAEGGR